MALLFPGQGVQDRDVILGVKLDGAARAFPLRKVRGQSQVEDKIAGVPVALVTGPDGESVRVFRSQWNGLEIELYRDAQSNGQSREWRLLASQRDTWNFAGCGPPGAPAGPGLGQTRFLQRYSCG